MKKFLHNIAILSSIFAPVIILDMYWRVGLPYWLFVAMFTAACIWDGLVVYANMR